MCQAKRSIKLLDRIEVQLELAVKAATTPR